MVKMKTQKTEKSEHKKFIKSVVSKLGKIKHSYRANKENDYYLSESQKIVESNIWSLSKVKSDKLEELKTQIKNINYRELEEELIKNLIENGKTVNIKTIMRKKQKDMMNQFYYSMVNDFDVYTHLENELKENPHKFTITVTYDYNAKNTEEEL